MGTELLSQKPSCASLTGSRDINQQGCALCAKQEGEALLPYKQPCKHVLIALPLPA